MCLLVDSFQVLVRKASRCLHGLHLPRPHDSGVGGKGPLLVRPSACFAERKVTNVRNLGTFLTLAAL